MSFLVNSPLLNPIRLLGWQILTRSLAEKNLALVSAGTEPERQAFYALLRDTRNRVNMVLTDGEAYSIYSGVTETARLPGVIGEVGVFKGGSARLICAAKGTRELHLFDTFEGLPPSSGHDPLFRAGTFKGGLEEVQASLKDHSGIQFHKGLFPDSAQGLEHLRFSFVHLDVDLYESTKGSLEWFYPRMVRGAMLISHDFQNAEGVRRAFREFFADKPECLIELSGSQVAFIRLGE